MTEGLALLFEIDPSDAEAMDALRVQRKHLLELFEIGMANYPHFFEEFFGDADRAQSYFLGPDVHTKISLLLLRYIDKCMTMPILDDGLPFVAAWHKESIRRHLCNLKWWQHWSFHLLLSSPSSEELVKYFRGHSAESFKYSVEVHDGIDFAHFNNRLSSNDITKAITQYLLVCSLHVNMLSLSDISLAKCSTIRTVRSRGYPG
jgi:hypothetical protein